MAAIDEAMRAGLDRVILGTVAVKEPELVLAAVQKYGSRIVVSIDVAGDQVAVSGWKEVSGVRFEQLAAQMVRFGVQRLIFTDTRKDGTLTGPNIETLRVFLSAAGVPVILAGGMGRVEDVKRLKPLEPQGLEGVVIGKALYDRRIRLEEALQEAGPQVYAG